jgi:hypothetical protein
MRREENPLNRWGITPTIPQNLRRQNQETFSENPNQSKQKDAQIPSMGLPTRPAQLPFNATTNKQIYLDTQLLSPTFNHEEGRGPQVP